LKSPKKKRQEEEFSAGFYIAGKLENHLTRSNKIRGENNCPICFESQATRIVFYAGLGLGSFQAN